MDGSSAQKNQIEDNLEAHGWRLRSRHDDLDWWGDEEWEIESIWRPAGLTVFITFMVHFIWEGPRKRGEGVWALTCTTEPVEYGVNHNDEGRTIQVTPGWEKHYPCLWKILDEIRNSAA